MDLFIPKKHDKVKYRNIFSEIFARVSKLKKIIMFFCLSLIIDYYLTICKKQKH